jgi:hypothetical protein
MLNINFVLVKWCLILGGCIILAVGAYFKGYSIGEDKARREIAKRQQTMLETAQIHSEKYEEERQDIKKKLEKGVKVIYVSKNPDLDNCHAGTDWLREYKDMD